MNVIGTETFHGLGVGNPCYGRGSDVSQKLTQIVFKAFRHQFSIYFDERKCETECNDYVNTPV